MKKPNKKMKKEYKLQKKNSIYQLILYLILKSKKKKNKNVRVGLDLPWS